MDWGGGILRRHFAAQAMAMAKAFPSLSSIPTGLWFGFLFVYLAGFMRIRMQIAGLGEFATLNRHIRHFLRFYGLVSIYRKVVAKAYLSGFSQNNALS